MSERKSEKKKNIGRSKKSEDRMLIEFENEIKRLINSSNITHSSLSKKAEEELEKIIDKMVDKYYE